MRIDPRDAMFKLQDNLTLKDAKVLNNLAIFFRKALKMHSKHASRAAE